MAVNGTAELVGRAGALRDQRVSQIPGPLRPAQPVRVRAQVGRPDQHRRDQAQLLGVGRADQHPDVPQAGLAERVKLGEPAGRALGLEPRPLLVEPAQHVERARAARRSRRRRSSVGSATTSQPNGRPISVVSAASNKVGAADARPVPAASHGAPEPAPAPAAGPAWPDPAGQDWPRQPPRSPGSGGAWRPGQGAQTSRSRSAIRLSAHGTPLAPQGNSSSHRSPRSGRPACRAGSLLAGRTDARRPAAAGPARLPGGSRRLGPHGARRRAAAARPAGSSRAGADGSGPALVISSSGAPPPRENQPVTNGRRFCAASSTAGSTEA